MGLKLNELKEMYGPFFSTGLRLWKESGHHPPSLRKSEVPESLWPLIPYAEFWGLSDDGIRAELIEEAPNQVWTESRNLILKHLDELETWIIAEADRKKLTQEYITFAFMYQVYNWPREM
jgi:hypothetical protein